MATNDSTYSPDSVHNPITSEGQAAGLTIERIDDVTFTQVVVKHGIDKAYVVTLDRLLNILHIQQIVTTQFSFNLETANRLHAALTEAIAQATALTAPQPPAPETEFVCWTTPDGEIKSRYRPVAAEPPRNAPPARPQLTAAQRRILKRIDKREQKGIPLQLSEATLADKRQLVRLGQMGLLKTLYPETDRTGLVLTAAGRAALDGAK